MPSSTALAIRLAGIIYESPKYNWGVERSKRSRKAQLPELLPFTRHGHT
jgi:hypothetical protein